jgi:hypothetical protein
LNFFDDMEQRRGGSVNIIFRLPAFRVAVTVTLVSNRRYLVRVAGKVRCEVNAESPDEAVEAALVSGTVSPQDDAEATPAPRQGYGEAPESDAH